MSRSKDLKKLFTCLLVCAAIAAGPDLTAASDPCGNFMPGSMSPERIFDEYAGAVLRIESGSETGTGYLIDSGRGFVLTAAHVVKASLNNRSAQITATSPELAGIELSLKPVYDLRTENIDLALLQLEQEDILSDVRALDMSLRLPKAGSSLCIMGYPRGVREIRKKTGNFVALTSEGLLEIEQAAFPGDSGSPIVDSYGTVIGTCIKRLNATTARYLPTVDALGLISGISISDRVSDFDEGIRNGSLDIESFKKELKPKSTRTSNVELLSWAYHIAAWPNKYVTCGKYFKCPIVPAFWHRRLDDAVFLLGSLVASDIRGRALLNMSRRARDRGQHELAISQIEESILALRDAIRKRIESAPQGIVYSWCSSGLVGKLDSTGDGTLDGSFAFGQPHWLQVAPSDLAERLRKDQTRSLNVKEVCSLGESDPYLAALFQDYAVASITLARLSAREEKSNWHKEAVGASILAVWTTDSKKQRAISFTVLGDAFRGLDDKARSANAYATAHSLGFRAAWVQGNWAYASGKAPTSKADLKEAIEKAPTMTSKQLYEEVIPTGVPLNVEPSS